MFSLASVMTSKLQHSDIANDVTALYCQLLLPSTAATMTEGSETQDVDMLMSKTLKDPTVFEHNLLAKHISCRYGVLNCSTAWVVSYVAALFNVCSGETASFPSVYLRRDRWTQSS